MKTVADVCKFIGSIIVSNPLCVETGTMYTCPPGNEPHNTTSNIMQFICDTLEGDLWSLDIDQSHIDFAKEFCSKLPKPADQMYPHKLGGGILNTILGDSVESLTKLALLFKESGSQIDLLCLDGKEFDEDHMVNEYITIKDCLAERHFVLVDDIHNPNSVKWVKMVPLLKELGYSYIEVPTPTGMFLATRGYDLP